MNRLLDLYEKLEKLVERLPEPLRKPILHEITPVKNVFLRRRIPRLVLLGQPGKGKCELLNAFFEDEAVPPEMETTGAGLWQNVSWANRGTLRILDARGAAELATGALAEEPPDLFLFLRSRPEIDDGLVDELDRAADLIEFSARRFQSHPRVIGVLLDGGGEEARMQFQACLHTRRGIGESLAATVLIPLAGEDQRAAVHKLAELITREIPEEAKLEMARLSGARAAQAQIAQILTRSVTAVCTAIGTQPIPLADFPILSSLQATMVAGIMFISGREMNGKLAGEFMGALGASLGIGLVLREGARAAVKMLPGWGNAISGAIAGAGTYAIGKAAVAYFIEGASINEARRLFLKRGNS